MEKPFFNLELTVSMVQDPNNSSYTAYFKQFPNIIVEGETDEKAFSNLMDAVHDVFKYKEKAGGSHLSAGIKVIEKPINFVTT